MAVDLREGIPGFRGGGPDADDGEVPAALAEMGGELVEGFDLAEDEATKLLVQDLFQSLPGKHMVVDN